MDPRSPGATVRRYEPADADGLLTLLRTEGSEWDDYHEGDGFERFRTALASSETYVVLDGAALCGFVRVRDDDGFGVFVYDVLVDRAHRRRGHARALLDTVRNEHPDVSIYVLSDEDAFYDHLGLRRVGTIFEIPPASESSPV